MACILLWSSAVRVHDSQAYRKMDLIRERISRFLELREIRLSFQTGFNLVNATVVCTILELSNWLLGNQLLGLVGEASLCVRYGSIQSSLRFRFTFQMKTKSMTKAKMSNMISCRSSGGILASPSWELTASVLGD